MANGIVKWFDPHKGFGFIQSEAGGKDIFVHMSALAMAGWRTLREGQVISFELLIERGRYSAGNMKSA